MKKIDYYEISKQKLGNKNHQQQLKILNIPVVVKPQGTLLTCPKCKDYYGRYCVALMYNKFGNDNKGRYIDYKIRQIIVTAINEDDAKKEAIKELKSEFKNYIHCVDSVLLIE